MTRDKSVEERLATIEVHVVRMSELEKEVKSINEKLSKQKGFYAGIATGVSALWAVIIFLFSYFSNRGGH